MSSQLQVIAGEDIAHFQNEAQAERSLRQVEILSIDEMSVQSGIDSAYMRALVDHKQVNPAVHARSRWVQAGGPEEEARAKQCARDHTAYSPTWRWMRAKESFDIYLKSPMGMNRFKSTGHRREMENLMRGMPANYVGPLGDVIKPLSDKYMADVKHNLEKRDDGNITAAVQETLGVEPQAPAAEEPPRKRIPGIS